MLIRLLSFFLVLAPLQGSSVLHADDGVLKTYLMLQNGITPSLTGDEYVAQRNLATYRIKTFTQDWLKSAQDKTYRCRRYGAALVETLSQIDQNLAAVPPVTVQMESDEIFLERVRLHLLIPTLFSLHALFSQKSEGGYGTLDRHQKVACTIDRRDSVQLSFDQLIQQLATFHRQALGNPGLLGFDQMTDRLLQISDRKEIHRERLSWVLLGATTVASIFFWEIAPPAVAYAARQMFGTLPGAFTNGYAIFAVRSATLMGEGVGWWLLDRQINPPEPETHVSLLGSWDEQMNEIEHLLASPVDSSDLDYTFITQIKAQLAMFYQPWLKQHSNQLIQLIGGKP